jgi:hypothetical protein
LHRCDHEKSSNFIVLFYARGQAAGLPLATANSNLAVARKKALVGKKNFHMFFKFPFRNSISIKILAWQTPKTGGIVNLPEQCMPSL